MTPCPFQSCVRRACAAALAVVALAGLAGGPARAQSREPEPFVAAFTTSVFAGASRSDAQSAVAMWANEIATTRQLHVAVATEFYESIDDARRAIDARRVHLLLLSLPEYYALQRPDFGQAMLGQRRGTTTERYLLVTKKGAVADLAGLRGRTLLTIDGLAEEMSRSWLDTRLAAKGLPPAVRHFAQVTHTPKAARGVLRVYFGQADACLVTATAFQTMVELNPQVGQTLAPLETSEPLVGALVLLDRQYAPAIREPLLDALVHLGDSARGRQVLQLFGVDGMTPAARGALDPSLALLRSVAERRPR